MNCERYQKLMMGYLDNELNEEDIQDLMTHLQDCDPCRNEMRKFRMLNTITDTSRFQTPEDKFWEGYWTGIYNRMERQIGWIVMMSGWLILISGGLFWLSTAVLFNPLEPLWLRLGIPLTMIGIVILMSSICRERWRAWKFERYKDVRR